jgi:hypothetical protein
MTSATELERKKARRIGFSGLTLWALLGLGLETAHGFKWTAYLDDELARELLRLAHAHGVLLSLVQLAYASEGALLFARTEHAGRPVRGLLTLAWLLMPLGFALGAWGHTEADPGFGICLVPLGAASLLIGLGWLTLASWRA